MGQCISMKILLRRKLLLNFLKAIAPFLSLKFLYRFDREIHTDDLKPGEVDSSRNSKKSSSNNNTLLNKFIHLHNYSYYSFYNSIMSCEDFINECIADNSKTLVLTVCFNMHVALELVTIAQKNKIELVIGQVFNITALNPSNKYDQIFKILLIAATEEGFINLASLSTLSWKLNKINPYIEIDLLDAYHKGLICLISGVESEISQNIINKKFKKAEACVKILKDIFPADHLYLELQNHG